MPTLQYHLLPMGFFTDKVVVVVGGGSGIGRACSRAYAREGARVHVIDLHEERARAVAVEIQTEGGRAVYRAADCACAEDMTALAEDIFRTSGRVDLLQNGAGILIAAPAERIPLEDWRRSVDVNLFGAIHGIHAFLPRMLQQGSGGQIVNISSLAGLVGFPYTAPYSTAKFALVGLSEALNVELAGTGISVTAVCAGAVRSALIDHGTLDLPGNWGPRIREGHRRYGLDPDVLARRILRSVRRRRPLVLGTRGAWALWMTKRLFDGPFRSVFARLLRWAKQTGST